MALVGRTSGTAADVSRVAQVPRTRVYDAVEELRECGLVDVQQTSPREFRAVSGRTAVGHFEHHLQNRIDVLRTALDELAPRDPYEEQRGVWTVDGERTLVSVLAGDDGSDDGRTETAIWGVGEANGLVVVLRAMFTWRLRADE